MDGRPAAGLGVVAVEVGIVFCSLDVGTIRVVGEKEGEKGKGEEREEERERGKWRERGRQRGREREQRRGRLKKMI